MVNERKVESIVMKKGTPDVEGLIENDIFENDILNSLVGFWGNLQLNYIRNIYSFEDKYPYLFNNGNGHKIDEINMARIEAYNSLIDDLNRETKNKTVGQLDIQKLKDLSSTVAFVCGGISSYNRWNSYLRMWSFI
jgi:hypothetical protein